MYARFGIPIAFFSSGSHRDYHQVTDEPQYIDYEKMAHVSRLVATTALRVADARSPGSGRQAQAGSRRAV